MFHGNFLVTWNVVVIWLTLYLFVLQLARCGMKIALISRSQEKLDQVASQISKYLTTFFD